MESTPTQVSSTETAIKQKREAGSGQFSLFGEDAGEGKVEVFSGRMTLGEVPHLYQPVKKGKALQLFLKSMMQQKRVCFDTETTSLNPLEAELVGIAFSWEAHKGFYVPFPEDQEEASDLLGELRPFFESREIEKVGQNLKYDIKVLHRYGMPVMALV